VQTLTQFFHCKFQNKIFSLTNSNISSPVVLVFNSLRNKHLLTNFCISYESNVCRKVSFSGTISRLSTCRAHSKANWSSASKCSTTWSFVYRHSLIDREIVSFVDQKFVHFLCGITLNHSFDNNEYGWCSNWFCICMRFLSFSQQLSEFVACKQAHFWQLEVFIYLAVIRDSQSKVLVYSSKMDDSFPNDFFICLEQELRLIE